MSHVFWRYLAVPIAGYLVLTFGILWLLRREPHTRVRSYLLWVAAVSLATYVAWDQIQTAADREWALNRADGSERALARQTDPVSRLCTMDTAAHAALNVGRTERATYWANELLDMAREHAGDSAFGSAIHTGHIVLGRIAVQAGDIQEGKRHLLAAGDTPGSPTLNSFGPDMLLARELLVRGETDTVLEYLDRCALFWPRTEQLRQWKRQIARGDVPDFEGNFHY